MTNRSRSREGAWIEIFNTACSPKNANVAPVRERGLKLNLNYQNRVQIVVAPVRERGLKLINMQRIFLSLGRSREGAWIEIERHKHVVDF